MIPSIHQLNEYFFNENKCIDYLFEKKLINQPTSCNLCNYNLYRYQKTFRCINPNCRKSISIYKDSFFSKHHIYCNNILFLAYLWLTKIRCKETRDITKFSKDTICDYYKIFRNIIISFLTEEDEVLGGNKVIVEIDESKFEDLWVVGITERNGNKKCYFEVVRNRNYATLYQFIRKHIRPGSTVYSDSWKGYNNLKSLNIKHIRVNHSKHYTPQQKIK